MYDVKCKCSVIVLILSLFFFLKVNIDVPDSSVSFILTLTVSLRHLYKTLKSHVLASSIVSFVSSEIMVRWISFTVA